MAHFTGRQARDSASFAFASLYFFTYLVKRAVVLIQIFINLDLILEPNFVEDFLSVLSVFESLTRKVSDGGWRIFLNNPLFRKS